MDGCSGKRGATGIMTPRKGYNVGLKDANTGRDQNAQFCNRIGCSGRIKYTSQSSTKIGSSDKAKCSKTSFCSSNGNETIGNSSRSGSVVKNAYLDSKRKLEFDPSESSQSGDSEAADIGSSSAPSNTRSRRTFQHKTNNQNTLPASRSSSLGTLGASTSTRSSYGLRSLKCNSISDAAPPSRSSSESKSVGKNVMKKRSTFEGESSFSRRGRQTTSAASVEDNSATASSVRTRRLMNANNSRMRLSSYRQNGRNGLSLREPSVNAGRLSSSQQQFPANDSSSGSSSFSLSGSNDENQSTMMMPFVSGELGFGHFMNRDVFPLYSMDGIAEVLLALERIEQDEELTHEQVLALETSLFLSGLNLYDQHRDMRLDIDNMSYEELLALGERMGTVSTALSEEAISKCITRSVYQATPLEVRTTGSAEDGDDIKCTICQEEYVLGDEIGKLIECQHRYHMTCVNQWLRMKNWCPICKAAAAPQQSSSS